MSDESGMGRAVREWQRQVPEMGAGAALNAFIPALAEQMASAGSMVELKAQLDLIEEQHQHQQEAAPEVSV
ncbi:hypothetical protein [Streptomyces sp. H39-S7]|uniref:hypothetical protein n=1 Tax=Streptomyces sp. H39-S7 TaxID=3004357 RepID=UPI0022AF64A1|nr:hypothetical protein [Streptomyces sp. H39-S7]MCZ4125434.1 hypothetical protein [Streptomyces sp. H39-S7]